MDLQSYILAKRYTEESLQGAGALKGKSAYEIACDNGFEGTEAEWLTSITPQIGPNGNWWVGEVDTGYTASSNLQGYATVEYVKQLIESIEVPEGTANVVALTEEEILEICQYTNAGMPGTSTSTILSPMTKDEVLDICK